MGEEKEQGATIEPTTVLDKFRENISSIFLSIYGTGQMTDILRAKVAETLVDMEREEADVYWHIGQLEQERDAKGIEIFMEMLKDKESLKERGITNEDQRKAECERRKWDDKEMQRMTYELRQLQHDQRLLLATAKDLRAMLRGEH